MIVRMDSYHIHPSLWLRTPSDITMDVECYNDDIAISVLVCAYGVMSYIDIDVSIENNSIMFRAFNINGVHNRHIARDRYFKMVGNDIIAISDTFYYMIIDKIASAVLD